MHVTVESRQVLYVQLVPQGVYQCTSLIRNSLWFKSSLVQLQQWTKVRPATTALYYGQTVRYELAETMCKMHVSSALALLAEGWAMVTKVAIFGII